MCTDAVETSENYYISTCSGERASVCDEQEEACQKKKKKNAASVAASALPFVLIIRSYAPRYQATYADAEKSRAPTHIHTYSRTQTHNATRTRERETQFSRVERA